VEWHNEILTDYTPVCRACAHAVIVSANLENDLDIEFMNKIGAEILATAGGAECTVSLEYPCYLLIMVDGYEFTYGDGDAPNTKCLQTAYESGADVPNTATPATHAREFWLTVEHWAISR
jgi:hypothetical protein